MSGDIKYTFPKSEKLCSKKAIASLFNQGRQDYQHPVKIYYQLFEADAHKIQVLISVSKRNFKKAVHRNFIKRKLREAVRLNKHLLAERFPRQTLNLAVVYTGRELPAGDRLQSIIFRLFERLAT